MSSGTCLAIAAWGFGVVLGELGEGGEAGSAFGGAGAADRQGKDGDQRVGAIRGVFDGPGDLVDGLGFVAVAAVDVEDDGGPDGGEIVGLGVGGQTAGKRLALFEFLDDAQTQVIVRGFNQPGPKGGVVPGGGAVGAGLKPVHRGDAGGAVGAVEEGGGVVEVVGLNLGEGPAGGVVGERDAAEVGEAAELRGGQGIRYVTLLDEVEAQAGDRDRDGVGEVEQMVIGEAVGDDVFDEGVAEQGQGFGVAAAQQGEPGVDGQVAEVVELAEGVGGEGLDAGVGVIEQGQQLLRRERRNQLRVVTLDQLQGPVTHETAASVDQQREQGIEGLGFLPEFGKVRVGGQLGEGVAVGQVGGAVGEAQGRVPAVAGVHEGPVVEDVFTLGEVVVAVPQESVNVRPGT